MFTKEIELCKYIPKKKPFKFFNQATLTIEGPSTPCTPCTYSTPVLFLINTNKNLVHSHVLIMRFKKRKLLFN